MAQWQEYSLLIQKSQVLRSAAYNWLNSALRHLVASSGLHVHLHTRGIHTLGKKIKIKTFFQRALREGECHPGHQETHEKLFHFDPVQDAFCQ